MVPVHMEIAIDMYSQIKESMSGKPLQHMVEETNAGVHVAFPRAVQNEGRLDLRFLCIPFYSRCSWHDTLPLTFFLLF